MAPVADRVDVLQLLPDQIVLVIPVVVQLGCWLSTQVAILPLRRVHPLANRLPQIAREVVSVRCEPQHLEDVVSAGVAASLDRFLLGSFGLHLSSNGRLRRTDTVLVPVTRSVGECEYDRLG